MQYIENDRIKVAVADHGAELCGIYDKKRGHEVVWQADPDSPATWISHWSEQQMIPSLMF